MKSKFSSGTSFQQLIEAAGFEARSYSGRGMYGKSCLGVDIDCSPFAFIADIFEALEGFSIEDDDAYRLARAIRGARTDAMGRGTIVYFPEIEFVDEGANAASEAQS